MKLFLGRSRPERGRAQLFDCARSARGERCYPGAARFYREKGKLS
jgi:hypothetical protein